jgi:hypothetical protein
MQPSDASDVRDDVLESIFQADWRPWLAMNTLEEFFSVDVRSVAKLPICHHLRDLPPCLLECTALGGNRLLLDSLASFEDALSTLRYPCGMALYILWYPSDLPHKQLNAE